MLRKTICFLLLALVHFGFPFRVVHSYSLSRVSLQPRSLTVCDRRSSTVSGRNRGLALFAKKKKLVSDDFLSSLDESERESNSQHQHFSEESDKTLVKEKTKTQKGNKLSKLGISEDLLSSLVEDEHDTSANSKQNKTDKKLSKLGISEDLLSSIEDDLDDDSDQNKKKKKDKDKDKKKGKEDVDAIDSEKSDKDADDSDSVEEIVAEQRTRKEKPSSRVRFTESSQPGYVMMGLDKVEVMYGDTVVLKDASFTVTTGERIGLVGPNGGGKVSQSFR